MLSKDKYNPVADEWKRKYNSQSDIIKQKIDEIDKLSCCILWLQ